MMTLCSLHFFPGSKYASVPGVSVPNSGLSSPVPEEEFVSHRVSKLGSQRFQSCGRLCNRSRRADQARRAVKAAKTEERRRMLDSWMGFRPASCDEGL